MSENEAAVGEKAMSEKLQYVLDATEIFDREIRIRCLEAAARSMHDAGFDAGSREQLILDTARRFYWFVAESGL